MKNAKESKAYEPELFNLRNGFVKPYRTLTYKKIVRVTELDSTLRFIVK